MFRAWCPGLRLPGIPKGGTVYESLTHSLTHLINSFEGKNIELILSIAIRLTSILSLYQVVRDLLI